MNNSISNALEEILGESRKCPGRHRDNLELLWDVKTKIHDDDELKCMIDLVQPDSDDLSGRYGASISWSGCVDFFTTDESEGQEPDYIHICELHDTILRLIGIWIHAKKIFGANWPNL